MSWFECSKNECPVCREHFPGGCTLGDDRHYDHLISIIHPDVAQYEEEVKMIIFLIDDVFFSIIHVRVSAQYLTFKYECLLKVIAFIRMFNYNI